MRVQSDRHGIPIGCVPRLPRLDVVPFFRSREPHCFCVAAMFNLLAFYRYPSFSLRPVYHAIARF